MARILVSVKEGLNATGWRTALFNQYGLFSSRAYSKFNYYIYLLALHLNNVCTPDEAVPVLGNRISIMHTVSV